jgi:chloramphenicol O-acetyltransferase type A
MTDPADSVPRIAWGRFEEKNGKYLLGMNLEVNHRLIDGIHIAQFHDAFQKIAQSLNPEMI